VRMKDFDQDRQISEYNRFYGPQISLCRHTLRYSAYRFFCDLTPIFQAFFGVSVSRGVRLEVGRVMAVFEEWFEYEYEEVLLGVVKAEQKRGRLGRGMLTLRRRRAPRPIDHK
jgi:hypothetical protein